MGQQQLLLIILGVIIVGIAVAVGITMFTGGARDANRDAVSNDLVNLAAKAHQFYRRPVAMGGGGNTFEGFDISDADSVNANGSYVVLASDPGVTPNVPIPYPTESLPEAGAQELWIFGQGVETGNDGVNKVQSVIHVTQDKSTATVLN